MKTFNIAWYQDSSNPRYNDHMPTMVQAEEFRMRKLIPESEGNTDMVIEFLVGGEPRFTFFKIPDSIVDTGLREVQE